MSLIGQPLMGYPVGEGDNIYVNLGCGDVVSTYSASFTVPTVATCPVHGSQNTIGGRVISVDETSVARSC